MTHPDEFNSLENDKENLYIKNENENENEIKDNVKQINIEFKEKKITQRPQTALNKKNLKTSK